MGIEQAGHGFADLFGIFPERRDDVRHGARTIAGNSPIDKRL